MWQLLETEVSKAESANQTIGIFHYSPHEKTWWKNFARRHAGKPGVPTEEAAEEMDAVADTVKAAVTEEAAEAKTEVKEVMADAQKEMKEAAKLVKEEANKAAQATKEAANSAAEKLEKKAKEAKEAFKK
jgi:colicin import membrane protein